ncbi:uncharacterized protein [Argopecten irradians]|uniref:uncharacterized protein isoform X2 n=1 Tax=Argopecten irradians TaxID=31199 RepID=UPI003717FDD9
MAFEHVLWQRFLTTVIIYGSACSLVRANGCPEDKIGRVIACLTSPVDQHEESSSVLLSGRDVGAMEKYCRTGGSAGMLNCITNLFDNCTKADDRQILIKFVDRKRLNATFALFCADLDVYRSNSGCISAQEAIVHACHTDERKTLAPLRPIHLVCRNFEMAYKCSTEPVTKMCGQKTGDIIGNFLRGITPPICYGHEYREPASTAHVSTAYHNPIIVVIFAFTKLFIH